MANEVRTGLVIGASFLGVLWGVHQALSAYDPAFMAALDADIHDKITNRIVEPITDFGSELGNSISDTAYSVYYEAGVFAQNTLLISFGVLVVMGILYALSNKTSQERNKNAQSVSDLRTNRVEEYDSAW